MKLIVNKEKKENIQKIINSNQKGVVVIRRLEKIALLLVAAGAIYALLNIFVPSWGLVDLNGVMVKDYLDIILNTGILIVVGLCLFLFMRVFRNQIAGLNSNERIDEQLTFENDELIYVYRVKYQSQPTERIIVKLPLREMKRIIIEKNYKRIVFEGLMYGDNISVENGNNEVVLEDEENGIFTIYDYFEPSLEKILRENGFCLEENEGSI